MKLEFSTIRNLSSKINSITYFYLKLVNYIPNHNNIKANYKSIKKLKYMFSMYHYPKFNYIILKKDIPNFLNNNSSKKPL